MEQKREIVTNKLIEIGYSASEAADAVKGDSATTPNKIAVLETGAKISVPIFIKQGDIILVNTQTGQYVERAN